MNIYEQLKTMLQNNNIVFSEKEHSDEGYGTNVAQIHGLDEKFGAKAIVLKLKYSDAKISSENETRFKPEYCLAVLSFIDKVDASKIAKYFNAKKASFASRDESQLVTNCEPGSIPPISFNENLPVIIDETLSHFPKLFFNIGRLDRSISLNTNDFLTVVKKSVVKHEVTSFANTTQAKSVSL